METRKNIRALDNFLSVTPPTKITKHKKLYTAKQVREIRIRAKSGDSHRKLAEIYGGSKQAISQAIYRKTYRWVD